MRISDWSSDVCSSDLFPQGLPGCGIVDADEQLEIGHPLRSAAKIDADPEPDARAVTARRTANADRDGRAAALGQLFDAIEGDADEERRAFARSGGDQPLPLKLLVDRGAVAVPFERWPRRRIGRAH